MQRRKNRIPDRCVWINFSQKWEREAAARLKEFARKGRIQVNGQTVKAADTKVNPEKDEIFLDGVPVSYAGWSILC